MPKLTDASLAKSIKRVFSPPISASSAETPSFGELRAHARSSALTATIEQLERLALESALDPVQAQSWLRLCVELREQKMHTSAKCLWKQRLPLISMVSFEEWIAAAPAADSIEAARKALDIPAPAFIDRLLSLGATLYETSGAEWLLQHGATANIGSILDAALDRRPRPGGLDEARRMLAAFLKKDPHGLHLLNAMARATAEPRLATLAETSAQQITLHAGKLAREFPVPTAKLIELMFSRRGSGPKAARAAGVELAQFATGILKMDPVPPEVAPSLEVIAKLGAEIRISVLDRTDAGPLWTFEPVTNRTDRGPLITIEGARQWGLVYARACIDGRDLGYLESFAANVGLHEFAAAGDAAVFNPSLHEDTEGGLLSGDIVLVVSSGWQLDGVTVVKAKVRPRGANT